MKSNELKQKILQESNYPFINLKKNYGQFDQNKIYRENAIMTNSSCEQFLTTVENSLSIQQPYKQQNTILINDYSNQSFTKNDKKRNINKLSFKRPQNEELNFIFKLLYGNETNNSKNLFNIKDFSNFILKIQKNFNLNNNNKCHINSKNIKNKIMEFQSLISKYSLIIFFHLKNNFHEKGGGLFLLMLKENLEYLELLEYNLYKLLEIKKETDVNSIYYKETYTLIPELIKIYSFIIKYSRIFNFNKYMTMFTIKYIKIQELIYKIFLHKNELRKSNFDDKNVYIYIFSFLLHNISYFAILNYWNFCLPIKLLDISLNIYQKIEEEHYLLRDREKELIIASLYNKGLLLFENGENYKAIETLEKSKEKVFNDSSDKNLLRKKGIITINIDDKLRKESEENNLYSINGDKNIKNYTIIKSNDILYKLANKTINENKDSFIDNIEDININSNEVNTLSENPQLYSEPLYRKIEFLLGEIEINNKNYTKGYLHLNTLLNVLKNLKSKLINTYTKSYKQEYDKVIKYIESINKKSKENNNDINKEIYIYNNTNKKIKKQILREEISKFFIFLNSLSIYQIKILNETQPKDKADIKNILPIYFSNQFKDTLSYEQQNTFNNLNITLISRYYILKNPNDLIISYNINTKIFEENKINDINLHNVSLKKKIPKINIGKEHSIYNTLTQKDKNNLELIMNKVAKNEFLHNYFEDNKILLIKLIKGASKKEIEKYIKMPYLIEEAINNYYNINKKNIKRIRYSSYDKNNKKDSTLEKYNKNTVKIHHRKVLNHIEYENKDNNTSDYLYDSISRDFYIENKDNNTNRIDILSNKNNNGNNTIRVNIDNNLTVELDSNSNKNNSSSQNSYIHIKIDPFDYPMVSPNPSQKKSKKYILSKCRTDYNKDRIFLPLYKNNYD